jgi:transcriptional regulator with XRE-family HTH domain
VKLRCHLREARGKRPLREITETSGVQQAYLSQIETGRRLPKDSEIEGLTRAYGIPLDEMYDFEPPQFVLVEVDPKEEA